MKNSKEIILKLTELFTNYLEELKDQTRTDFIHGEMTAYVECLEIISQWEHSTVSPTVAQKYKI